MDRRLPKFFGYYFENNNRKPWSGAVITHAGEKTHGFNREDDSPSSCINTVGHTGIYACGHCVRQADKVTC